MKDLEGKNRQTDSTLFALKQKIEYYREKLKNRDQLENEISCLKQKINDLKSLELVLTGTREQVNDVVRHNRDPKSLGILVTALKKLVYMILILYRFAIRLLVENCWTPTEKGSYFKLASKIPSSTSKKCKRN